LKDVDDASLITCRSGEGRYNFRAAARAVQMWGEGEVCMRRRAITIAITIAQLLLIATPGEAQQRDAAVERARRYVPLIVAAATSHRVDPRLLWTVAWLETRFRHYDEQGRVIRSEAGAKGIMQIMPGTAAQYGWRDEHDAAQAIDAAARYLRYLQGLFAGRLDQILAAYNAGEGAVGAFRDGLSLTLPSGKVVNPKRIRSPIPPYQETVEYVKNGLAVFRTLARANHFSEPQLARLQNIEPEGQDAPLLVAVELEEAPEELRKGTVYAGEGPSDNPSDTPNLPKNSTSRSVYSRY
jgi:soluble lytic murein transglycosylase-like protein